MTSQHEPFAAPKSAPSSASQTSAGRTFNGVIAPLLTPFGEDGTPDPERFIAHAEWLLANGCSALAPFGTTSEGNSLGVEERLELLEELVDAGIEPSRLLPGTGVCALSDTITLTQHAVELECGGCLVLPPFYYKAPSDDGLFRYFSEVIETIGDDRLRIYLYHIPQFSHVGFGLPLIERLLRAYPDTIAGLKDSTGDWSNTKAILTAFPHLEVFPASEAYLLDGLRAGAAGIISASANVNSAAMAAVFDDWQGPTAAAGQAALGSVRSVIQSHPMIPLLKALVAHYRADPGWTKVRPPLDEMSPPEAAEAITRLERDHGFKMTFAEAGPAL